MQPHDDNSPLQSGELLLVLRHGVRQAMRLAERIDVEGQGSPPIGAMHQRLAAIRDELDSMAISSSNPDRRADNDPLWLKRGSSRSLSKRV